MSDLVGNPEDRFSRVAHVMVRMAALVDLPLQYGSYISLFFFSQFYHLVCI